MSNQRMVLVFALLAILLMIAQAWFKDHQTVKPPASAIATQQSATGGTQTQSAAATSDHDVPQAPESSVPAQAKTAPIAVTAPPASLLPAGQPIQVTTDVLRATIDTDGGTLRRLFLVKYPVAADKPNQPYELLNDHGPNAFVSQSGLIGAKGSVFPNHKTRYRAERNHYTLAPGASEVQVPLHWTGPDGVRYTLLYTFHRNSYVVDVSYKVDNASAKAWKGYLYGQFLHGYHEEKHSFMHAEHSYIGGAYYTPDTKFKKESFSDMEKKDLAQDTKSGWVAMLQHYFVGAWLPTDSRPLEFYSRGLGDNLFNIGFKDTQPKVIAPGKTGELDARIYLGPKEHTLLTHAAKGLVLAIDYGWLTPISAPLFVGLKFIHSLVGNWGWAIIILTILIKLAFYPLSATSYKSMARMKRMQPRLKSLKERYKDDKAKYNQAMMEVYKTEKINPMGGCLPILVQVPVFIALYWVLLESVELRQAPFIFWIHDLSAKDPYYVLPVIMGISMFAQQLLSPSPATDPMQRKLMMGMPIVFTFFFLFFPSGLVLYWVVNNLLSIAQQWRINHVMSKSGK